MNYKNCRDRNIVIDYLRALGIILVILAHVNPPSIINNIRTFDVVMLVFLSGMCINSNDSYEFKRNLLNRIYKVVLPSWMVVVTICTLIYLGSIIFKSFSIKWSYFFNSFFFIDTNSIGFVWISKVFFFIALMIPVLKYGNRLIKSDEALYLLGYCVLFVASCCIEMVEYNILLNEYIVYLIQYSIIAMFGLRFSTNINNRGYYFPKNLFIISLTIFICCQIYYNSLFPSTYKYPPHIFWLSYGVILTIFVYHITNKIIEYTNKSSNNLLLWVSRNSFKIYISHIYCIWTSFFLEKVIKFHFPWIMKYFVILAMSSVITYLYNMIKIKYIYKKL